MFLLINVNTIKINCFSKFSWKGFHYLLLCNASRQQNENVKRHLSNFIISSCIQSNYSDVEQQITFSFFFFLLFAHEVNRLAMADTNEHMEKRKLRGKDTHTHTHLHQLIHATIQASICHYSCYILLQFINTFGHFIQWNQLRKIRDKLY